MFEQDWMLRQIEALIQFVARVIFKRDEIGYDSSDLHSPSEADLLHRRLLELIAQDEFGKAEDLLFTEYKADDRIHLLLAMDFYHRLNEIREDRLEAHDFSREEIQSGLSDILARSGISIELQ